MSSLVTVLSVTAALVGFQDSLATLDKGQADGLRAGDRGAVYYLLSNGQEEFRFEVTEAKVVDCSDFTCRVQPLEPLQASPGYRIQISIPAERTAFPTLLVITTQRIRDRQVSEAARYLDRLSASALGDPDLVAEVASLRRRLDQLRQPRTEPPPEDPRLSELQQALAAGQTARAEALLIQLQDSDIDPSLWQRQRVRLEELRARTMFRVEGQSAQFGLDPARASYHNQTPVFRERLETFWIDRQPVSLAELDESASQADLGNRAVRGVAYADAERFCRASGKRLPTELEWELAARHAAFQSEAGLSEWTSSWYGPYPGNTRPEPEYGERFKVVRGHDLQGSFRPTQRFLLPPDERDAEVGFRCAVEPISSGKEG